MIQKTDEQITAGALIARFGDQAYHQSMVLACAAEDVKDVEAIRRLRDVAAELRARGFHRHPVRDGAPAGETALDADRELNETIQASFPPELRPLVEELADASFVVLRVAEKLARAAYEAGKRGEEWPG